MEKKLIWGRSGWSTEVKPNRIARLLLSLVSTGVLIACAEGIREEEVGPAPDIVARIDDQFIDQEELRSFVDGIPANLRVSGAGTDVRRQYLRSLLGKHLMELEARARGLDTVSTVRSQVEQRWRSHLAQQYRRRMLAETPRLNDREVQEYMERRQPHRYRKVAGILVDEWETAEEVRRRLRQGEPFGRLAEEYSLDERSVAQDGVLGFVSMAQAQRLRIPGNLFLSLPVGEYSEVLTLGSRYQVISFVEDSLANPADYEPRIRTMLEQRQQADGEWDHVQALAEEFEWYMIPETRDLVLEKAAQADILTLGQFRPWEREMPLFAYRGGQLTIEDLFSSAWRTIRREGLPDSTAIARAADELMAPVLYYEAARREGLDRLPEQQAWLGNLRFEKAIKELRSREIQERVSVSEAEAREFYRHNQATFLTPQRYYLVEILVATEEEGREVLTALERGESLSSLAAAWSIRPEAQEHDGLIHIDDLERLTRPMFFQAVHNAVPGQVVGPVRIEEGYSVFEVLYSEGGGVAPFEEVERRARAFVRLEKRRQVFEDLIDELLSKYADRMTVYRSGLTAALPDTMLTRLGGDAGS